MKQVKLKDKGSGKVRSFPEPIAKTLIKSRRWEKVKEEKSNNQAGQKRGRPKKTVKK